MKGSTFAFISLLVRSRAVGREGERGGGKERRAGKRRESRITDNRGREHEGGKDGNMKEGRIGTGEAC